MRRRLDNEAREECSDSLNWDEMSDSGKRRDDSQSRRGIPSVLRASVIPRICHVQNRTQSLLGFGTLSLRLLVHVVEHVAANVLVDHYSHVLYSVIYKQTYKRRGIWRTVSCHFPSVSKIDFFASNRFLPIICWFNSHYLKKCMRSFTLLYKIDNVQT